MAQVKRIRRNVSGIILLDKPLGFTSNAALQKVRWLLNAEKAGHTGSLDPLATGVLLLPPPHPIKANAPLTARAMVDNLRMGCFRLD